MQYAGGMRILRLELEDYRGFERLSLDFDPRLTVLLGENGAGKSTILNALSRPPTSADRRHGSANTVTRILMDQACGNDPLYECSISAGSTSGLGLPPWELGWLTLMSSTRSAGALNAASRELTGEFARDDRKQPEPSFETFLEWFWEGENYENQERARGKASFEEPQLAAVRQAIGLLEIGISNLYFERPRPGQSTPARAVVDKAGRRLAIEDLSDGERSLIALAASITRRAALSDPSAPLQAPIVVLIDELEIHLHPRWQAEVLPRLLRVFPNAQFIVTTHSPLVIMNVPSQSIRVLRDFRLVPWNEPTKGRAARDLLSDIFGAPERPAATQARFNEVQELIDRDRLDEARVGLRKLREDLGGNDSDVVRLDTLLAFLNE